MAGNAARNVPSCNVQQPALLSRAHALKLICRSASGLIIPRSNTRVGKPCYSSGVGAVHLERKPDFQPNQKVDNFVLEEPLGIGQDGEVWRARRVPIGKLCAIKFLNSVAQQDKMDRFSREIKILVYLDDPHIVQIQDQGTAWNPTTHDHVPYYVMEFLRAKPIHRALTEIQTDTRLAAFCTLFLQTLGALKAAHSIDITHGDIKPANILVLPEALIAKLSDFGFGLLPGEDKGNRDEYPSSSYKAPQGLTPKQADLYRVGKTLMECLHSLCDTTPASLCGQIRSLAERLCEDPANMSLDDSLTTLRGILDGVRTRGLFFEDLPQGVPEISRVLERGTLVYDVVHGQLQLSARTLAIVDLDVFQRLRTIKAYGTCELVFPSLSITRFEQGLGEYAMLTRQLQGLVERTALKDIAAPTHYSAAILAGLLLAAGSVPFALPLRRAIHDRRISPESRALELVFADSLSQQVVSDWGIEPTVLGELIGGDSADRRTAGWRAMESLLQGPLSASSLDWVSRASMRAGFHVEVDLERLLRALTVSAETGEILVLETQLPVLEQFHFARMKAIDSLICHHTIRAADSMLEYAFHLLEEAGVDFTAIAWLDDMRFLEACIGKARECGCCAAENLLLRLGKRQLHKRAVTIEMGDSSTASGLLREGRAAVERVRSELAHSLRVSIEPGAVLLDVDRPARSPHYGILTSDGRVLPGAEISPALGALEGRPALGRVTLFATPELTQQIAERKTDVHSIVIAVLDNRV